MCCIIAVNPNYAQYLLGNWVECHSAYGMHYGVLQAVRSDGIVLAIPRNHTVGASGYLFGIVIDLSDNQENTDFENVQFFIPFFLLFALRRHF